MSNSRKVAIVTGGGSGIGFAIAKKFVENGYRTVLVGRNESKLHEAIKSLNEAATYEACDLADIKSIPLLVERIASAYGRIDVLVNNAGINMKKELLEVTDDDFLNVVNINLLSVFSLSREVARYMTEQQAGTILNISSMAARYGVPKIIAYSASKTAIEGMTRAMAVELAPVGIRVNCIAPGYITTEMTKKALDSDPERKAKALGRTPLGRMGDPAEIAGTALFLASDDAGYITGAVLPVDGGNSIGF